MDIPASATELACDGEAVTDLAPLARLTALEKLSLRFTRVTDLAPLAGLTRLRELEITGCRTDEESRLYGCYGDEKANPEIGYVPLAAFTPVTDLAPLAGLLALEILHLDSTGVSDLTPLSGLERLRELTLRNTKVDHVPLLAKGLEVFVADGAPIAGIEGLRDRPALAVLGLFACKVLSLSPLEHDTGLRELRFWNIYPALTSLHGLESLDALTSLDLHGLDSADLGPLAGKTRLKRLLIQYASVTGVQTLAGLTGLTHLTLDAWDASSRGRGGTNLAPIGALTELRELNLGGNPGSLAPLSRLTKLEKVSLQGDVHNWVRFDLSPLAHAKGLVSLRIDEGEPTRLEALGALTALESLELINANGGASLQPLSRLTRLKTLSVDHWGPLDASVFEPLSHLESLTLSVKELKSLGSIARLASLRELVLDVKAPLIVDPLAALPSLQTLDLRNTPVASIAALGALTQLRSFAASGPLLTDLGPLAKWPSLESVNIGSASNLRSLEPLRDLLHLARVELSSVPVFDVEPIAGLPALRSLFVSGTGISREDEIRILRRIGGCQRAFCAAQADLRKSYRHAFR